MQSIKIKQRDLTDCGAACLASIGAYHKLSLPISRIRQFASTDRKGTNVLGLIEAANKMGFDARGVRGSFDSLFKIPTPAIAHVILNNTLHHYIVIYHVTHKVIKVMDPGDGLIHRHPHEEFKKIWSGVLVLLWPNQTLKSGNEKFSPLSRLWSLISPHKGIMTQALMGALVYTLVGLSTSIYLQKIVDHVLIDGNRNLLNLMSVGMILFLFLQIFIGSMKGILTLRTGQLIDAQLILGYYKHLLKLPQSFFDSMRLGEIISRVNDAVKIRLFLNEALTNLVVNGFILIFSFVIMFIYHWQLALIILTVIPCYSMIYYLTNKLNKKSERKIMESGAALESQFVESLNSISTLKYFGLETHANDVTENRFLVVLKNVYTSGINSIFTGSSSELLSRLFTIILLWVGSEFVLDNEITPGELLSFYAIIGYFTGPVGSILSLNKTVQNAIIASDRLFEIMDLEGEKDENQFTITQQMLGDIKFKGINFKYGSREIVFKDLNLLIPLGKITAVVGESGSGKSTLFTILQKIYLLQSGQIYIGDCDLQYVNTKSLRQIIGVVPQKIDLFAGNVIENIAIGESHPDLKKIISICTELGIIEFLEKLPNGLNTYLGENGATLSGGQKQRIAVARALYKQPDILILDEATSSLDSSSEKYVQKMIETLRNQNKTIILIAHRLSSVFKADKIVVLDNGTVAEEGTHPELMKNRKHYYRMWQNQFPSIEEKETSS